MRSPWGEHEMDYILFLRVNDAQLNLNPEVCARVAPPLPRHSLPCGIPRAHALRSLPAPPRYADRWVSF